MPVEFVSHTTSTSNVMVANTTAPPLSQPISFFRHERAPATACNTNRNIEKILPSSQPPISTPNAPTSDPDAGRPRRRAGRGAESRDSREVPPLSQTPTITIKPGSAVPLSTNVDRSQTAGNGTVNPEDLSNHHVTDTTRTSMVDTRHVSNAAP